MDDDQPPILVEDGKGEGGAPGLGQDRYLLARLKGMIELGLGAAVHQDLAPGEQVLDAVAGLAADMFQQKIQKKSGLLHRIGGLFFHMFLRCRQKTAV